MMSVLRFILLSPFALVYGIVVTVRNWLYDRRWFPVYSSPVKTVSIGNLAVGGTGKTPATEYLCRLFMNERRIAVLSRGYGRKTTGFRLISADDEAWQSGDEPLQLKRKLPALTVAVCEDRVVGLHRLETRHDLVLLDDAFQHRAVAPGFSVLLFDYDSLQTPRFLLPLGRFREPMTGTKRANVLLVTKCPPFLSAIDRDRAIRSLRPLPGQNVFFSELAYGELVKLDESATADAAILAGREIVLLTGIANPAPLLNELRRHTGQIHQERFADHHIFTPENIAKLARSAAGRTIVTTEKDAQRLRAPELAENLSGLTVYYLRVSMRLSAGDEARFNSIFRHYVHS